MVLQDDVILEEPELEHKVSALYEASERRIGYLSFRLAGDVRLSPLYKRARQALRSGPSALRYSAEEFNLFGGPREHLKIPRLRFEEFRSFMVGIKSPVCITPALRAAEPFLDEDFAPYCYDDVDLSLKSLRRGLINGLFPLRFCSEVEWGGTRKDRSFASRRGECIRLRNRALIWRKHGDFITAWNRRRSEGA